MDTTSPRPQHPSGSRERDDLVEALRRHRGFLLFTVRGITDEQARTRTTVSELTLGGLVKHVAETEANWATFMTEGAGTAPDVDWASIDWQNPPPEVASVGSPELHAARSCRPGSDWSVIGTDSL